VISLAQVWNYVSKFFTATLNYVVSEHVGVERREDPDADIQNQKGLFKNAQGRTKVATEQKYWNCDKQNNTVAMKQDYG